MKILPSLLACAALSLFAACAKENAPAAAGKSSASTSLVKAAGIADQGWLAKAVADYPLTTCPVSGDKLGGSMGPALDYLWRQPGQPDRLVRFCCASCLPDFGKEPAKYLKMIDDALAAQAKK